MTLKVHEVKKEGIHDPTGRMIGQTNAISLRDLYSYGRMEAWLQLAPTTAFGEQQELVGRNSWDFLQSSPPRLPSLKSEWVSSIASSVKKEEKCFDPPHESTREVLGADNTRNGLSACSGQEDMARA